eukprot:COSAG04_NODE_8175_length_1011_cov_1.489035_2_plen_97_part_01
MLASLSPRPRVVEHVNRVDHRREDCHRHDVRVRVLKQPDVPRHGQLLPALPLQALDDSSRVEIAGVAAQALRDGVKGLLRCAQRLGIPRGEHAALAR